MKKIILATLFCMILTKLSFGQYVKETYSKGFYTEGDSIKIKWPDGEISYANLKRPINHGTSSGIGKVITVYIGNDSLKIYADNYPYEKHAIININSSRGKTVAKFRFNGKTSNLSNEYVINNKGKVHFELPEVYELANIIWTLSPSGEKDSTLEKSHPYYKRVKEYFSPYLDHPIFQKLSFPDLSSTEYYEFRENSYMYHFKNDKIVNAGLYNYVMGSDYWSFSNLFTELLPLVEDFAKKSNFRAFYKKEQSFYNKEIARIKELLPIKNMWNWLENEFPKIKKDHYKIVFSPLIGGSHSTQGYSKFFNPKEYFDESIMFICGTYRYNNQKKLSNKQKEALMSGIVFTEIDHNYVNRVSYKYKKDINRIFADKNSFWAADNRSHYKSPMLVFNEYMTHAVFCLWLEDNYGKKVANFAIKKREEMNVGRRGFFKFKEFNKALSKIRKENKNLVVAELYPLILKWAEKYRNSNVVSK